jgi:hypothetical protein
MESYKQIEKYDVPKGIGVEVGTERKHGSTSWLAEYLKDKCDSFFTIDIDPAQAHKFEDRNDVKPLTGKAEDVLASPYIEDISFSYMDGYDIELEDNLHRWNVQYKSQGYEDGHTMKGCAMSHLKQAVIISEKSVDGCVVIFDDTIFKWHTIFGKGSLAVPYFISQGFGVVDAYEHTPGNVAGYVVLVKGAEGCHGKN